jgi:hypothetical protein
MAQLGSLGQDWLSAHSHYCCSEEISIQLNVPADFGKVHAKWVRDGEGGSLPTEKWVPPYCHPGDTTAYYAELKEVPHLTGLRASFTRVC